MRSNWTDRLWGRWSRRLASISKENFRNLASRDRCMNIQNTWSRVKNGTTPWVRINTTSPKWRPTKNRVFYQFTRIAQDMVLVFQILRSHILRRPSRSLQVHKAPIQTCTHLLFRIRKGVDLNTQSESSSDFIYQRVCWAWGSRCPPSTRRNRFSSHVTAMTSWEWAKGSHIR